MCTSNTVFLALTLDRQNNTFIVGHDAEGRRWSFRKQDVTFEIDGELLAVHVDRKRYERILNRESERAPMAEVKKTRRTRKCLRCKNEFQADAVTYICSPCKNTAAWRSGGDYSVAI